MPNDKICILHIITFPIGGGAEVLVREMVKYKTENIDKYAIYYNTRGYDKEYLELQDNEFVMKLNDRSFKSIMMLRQIIKNKLQKYKNIIVHTHLTWPFFCVPLSCIGLNVKLIFSEHATENNRRKYLFFRLLEPLFYAQYDKIVCVSDATKIALDKWTNNMFKNKTIVIKNGARIYDFKISKPKNKIHFISIASLKPIKNLHVSIEALSNIKDFDYEYNILGEGTDRHKLESLIERLNLKDKVHLIGQVKNIEQYLYQSDIMIIPSLYEGFGLVAVEAMSVGLGIVASNVPGLKDIVEENNLNSILVDDPTNPMAFATAIKQCVEKYKINYENMAISSRKQAEKYSLENMNKKYDALYNLLING